MKMVRIKLGDDEYLVTALQAGPINRLLAEEDEGKKALGAKILLRHGHLVTEEEPVPVVEKPKVSQGAVSTLDLG